MQVNVFCHFKKGFHLGNLLKKLLLKRWVGARPKAVIQSFRMLGEGEPELVFAVGMCTEIALWDVPTKAGKVGKKQV